MPLTKKNVLIIEDKFNIWLPVLKAIFPETEYSLIHYNYKGESDRNITDLSEIDLVISDFYLDDFHKTGVQIVDSVIKAKNPLIPVIFWTASMNPEVAKSTHIGESIFYKKKLDVEQFKQQADGFIDNYRAIKQFPIYNNYFNHRLKNLEYRELAYHLYTNAARYLESFFSHSKYHAVFNSHGLIHVQHVIDFAAELLFYAEGDGEVKNFSEAELLAIFCAIIIHDLGMMPDGYVENLESGAFRSIRNSHCTKIFSWILDKGKIRHLLGIDLDISNNSRFRYEVALICLFHDCNYSFEKFLSDNKLNSIAEYDYDMFSKIVDSSRLPAMAAIVALADKMDYSESRVPVGPARVSNYRSIYDEFEYLKNKMLIGHRIEYVDKPRLIFRIPGEYLPQLRVADDYYPDFKREIFSARTEYPKACLESARRSLIDHVLRKSWVNLAQGFKKSGIQFLMNLDIDFEFIEDVTFTPEPLLTAKVETCIGMQINDEMPFISLIAQIEKELKIKIKSKKLLTAGYSKDAVFLLDEIEDVSIPGNNCLQKKIMKAGEFSRIHEEVFNYKKVGLNYIRHSSLMGHIHEFKYLDWGAFLGSAVEDDDSELSNLQDIVKGFSKEQKQLQVATDFVGKIIGVFYEKIRPYRDNTGVIDFYRKFAQSRRNKANSIKDELLSRKDKDAILAVIGEFEEFIGEIEKQESIQLWSSLTHGDFTFRNVLLSGQNLIFIDFADAASGHYFFDFTKLEHYLRFELFFKIKCDITADTFPRNPERVDKFSQLLNSIWEYCRDLYQGSEKEFIFEMNLAQAGMHLWSLTFLKDYEIALEDRIAACRYFMDKASTALKIK